MDEDVLVKQPRFRWISPEDAKVVAEALRLAHGQPAREASLQGGRFVLGVVDPDSLAHDEEDLLQGILVHLHRRQLGIDREVRVPAQPDELFGEQREGQRVIDDARVDRALRHAAELRGLRILHQGDPVLALDRPEPGGPVRRGPGKDYADRLATALVRERAKKRVHRQVGLRPALDEDQLLTGEGDIGVRRNHVDVVRLDAHAVLDLNDLHRGRLGERLAEEARVSRIEMLDEDERHSGVRRKRLEELRKRFESAGGGANAHDGEWRPAGVRRRPRPAPALLGRSR